MRNSDDNVSRIQAHEAEIAASNRPRWARIIDKLSLTKWRSVKQHHTDGELEYCTSINTSTMLVREPWIEGASD